jgi:hypothetical protein
MTRLKWRSKLTCDDAAPVGNAGRRPANSGRWRIKIAIQLADVHGLSYHVKNRGQREKRMYGMSPTIAD